jgi:hypothetical protein
MMSPSIAAPLSDPVTEQLMDACFLRYWSSLAYYISFYNPFEVYPALAAPVGGGTAPVFNQLCALEEAIL